MKGDGLFLTEEIISDKRLPWSAKFVAAYYRKCTLEAPEHCCVRTNKAVAEYLGMPVRTLEWCKHRLKELGMIVSDGHSCRWLDEDSRKKERKRTKKK